MELSIGHCATRDRALPLRRWPEEPQIGTGHSQLQGAEEVEEVHLHSSRERRWVWQVRGGARQGQEVGKYRVCLKIAEWAPRPQWRVVKRTSWNATHNTSHFFVEKCHLSKAFSMLGHMFSSSFLTPLCL